jgi:hypothetical protein
MRPAKGIIQHPTIVMGGQQHKSATSFKPKNIDMTERAKLYRDLGIVWLSPTRGKVHTNVVISWLSLQWPQNHFKSPLIATERMEVGQAYTALVDLSMNRGELRKAFQAQYADMFADCPFVLTTEEDNVLPSDTVPRLLEAIMTCPDCGGEVVDESAYHKKNEPKWKCEKGHQGYDAVSGLYFIKTDPPIPMAFGAPTFNEKKMNFHPRSVADAVKGGKVLEVNGIAMGAALWRKDLFRRVRNTKRNPWFKTTAQMTQDLWFCKRAKLEAHARFGVHCGVRVGHYDSVSGHLF